MFYSKNGWSLPLEWLKHSSWFDLVNPHTIVLREIGGSCCIFTGLAYIKFQIYRCHFSPVWLTSLSLNYSFYRWILDKHTRETAAGSGSCYCIWKTLMWPLKTLLRLRGGGGRGVLRKLGGLSEGKGPLESWLPQLFLSSFRWVFICFGLMWEN